MRESFRAYPSPYVLAPRTRALNVSNMKSHLLHQNLDTLTLIALITVHVKITKFGNKSRSSASYRIKFQIYLNELEI